MIYEANLKQCNLGHLIKFNVHDLTSVALKVANRTLTRILISALTEESFPVFLEEHFALMPP